MGRQVIGVPVEALAGEGDHGTRGVFGDPLRDGFSYRVSPSPLQRTVGKIQALCPARPEHPPGRLELAGAYRGQIVLRGQHGVGDLAQLAPGQRDQADVQARPRTCCQRPAGEERLVVGMGEDGQDTAGGHDAGAPRRATVSAYRAS